MLIPLWQIWQVILFAFKEKRLLIFLALTIFVLVTAVVLFGQDESITHNTWWTIVEPIIGVSTLVVAIAVWIGELYRDWEAILAKRLTVRFIYNERPVFICENAYLAGEGDIRNWAQQIGAQMSGCPKLRFEPFIQQAAPKVIRDDKGQIFKLYDVTFTLTELPSPDDKGNNMKLAGEIVENYHKNKILIWKRVEQTTIHRLWVDSKQSITNE